jgi:CheY-like chemotaxis protein
MSQNPEAVSGRWRARVLVVNDDLRLAESVRSLLDDEGYDTRIARDGLAAIEILSDWPADLVLLDLMMPHLNGWDFLAKRTDDPVLARCLVVVWSVAPPFELARARELGADHCLPGGATDPDALLEVVSEVLSRRSGSTSASYSTSAPRY